MSDNKPLIFGMPVYVSNVVPPDAVFVRENGDIKRLIDLANGEKEVATLRAEVERLTRERDEARAVCRDHHLHACESCAVTESDLIAEKAATRGLYASVERLTKDLATARDELQRAKFMADEFHQGDEDMETVVNYMWDCITRKNRERDALRDENDSLRATLKEVLPLCRLDDPWERDAVARARAALATGTGTGRGE